VKGLALLFTKVPFLSAVKMHKNVSSVSIRVIFLDQLTVSK
jgi:hypothetical protein